MALSTTALLVGATSFACVALGLVYLALVVLSPVLPISAASERTYRTPSSSVPLPLPSITDAKATVELSVVVPAYNEKARIGIMLDEAIGYLEERELEDATIRRLPAGIERGSYEMLIVDDGSKDGTADVALELARGLEQKWSKGGRNLRGSIKVVTLVRNRGKGGSVRHGMLHASGARVLFADADGASHFPDVALLQAEMDALESSQDLPESKHYNGGHGVCVGSRAHLVRTEVVVKRSFLRNLLMRLFHTYLYVLGIRAIRDTQCGFKLHTRRTAAHLYPFLHSPAWIFDCELLLLASLTGIPAREVGIAWKEVDGSKIDLVRDSVKMAVDLLVIRGNHLLGRWERPAWVGAEVAQGSRAKVE